MNILTYFAQTSGTDAGVIISIVGILGTCVASLIWVIKRMFEKFEPLIAANTKQTAINNENSRKQARAIKGVEMYLRERNGRDAEVHKKNIEAWETAKAAMDASTEKVIEAVQHISSQHVDQQIVKSNIIDRRKEPRK